MHPFDTFSLRDQLLHPGHTSCQVCWKSDHLRVAADDSGMVRQCPDTMGPVKCTLRSIVSIVLYTNAKVFIRGI
jgi:hypothetical protein